jgi:hypothetical protein
VRRFYLVLPFLYGIAPVLALFANNSGQAKFSEAVLPLAVVTGVTLVLVPVFRLLMRGWLRGAVMLSLFWFLFFSYGHVAKLIGRYPIAGHNPANFKVLLPATILVGLAFFLALRRSRSEPVKVAAILSVSVGAMLLTSILTIVRFQQSVEPAPTSAVLPDERLAPGDTLRRPDIYYFILDRYGAGRMLTAKYDVDNSAFVSDLRQRGFYVADESRANYHVTAQSLASSLNMAHILPLRDAIGPRSTDWQPVFELIADNRLARFLKQQGYRYIHIGPEWEPTADNPHADVTYSYKGIPEFSMMLINTTAVYPVLYRLGINNADRQKFDGINGQLALLPSIPRGERSPKFVFIHMLVPHGPYVFNADGTYRVPEVSNVHSEADNFREQAVFISDRIRSVVGDILGAYGAEDQPVIVIQGDEGPYPTRTQPHSFDWTQATDEEINEKLRILNAIYAPGCESEFHEAMTPVNTFRIVLNHYFGTGLPLLPERSYTYRDLQHLYDFIDVTERINRFPG